MTSPSAACPFVDTPWDNGNFQKGLLVAGTLASDGRDLHSFVTDVSAGFCGASDVHAEQLRSVLPEVPYQKMIGILEMISKTPNQRHIYDSLQRAARDKAWEVQAARREGLATGERSGS